MECPNCNVTLPFYAALAHGGTRLRCRSCGSLLQPEPRSVERVTERTGLGGVLVGGPTGGVAMLVGLEYGAWLEAGLLMVGLLVGVTGSSMLYAARHLRFEPVHTPR